MHALLDWAIALSDVRTLFFDNLLIALHSFSFTQKIKDHSSLLSVRSIFKSDVPSSASPWPGTSREPGWGGGGVAVGHLLSPVLRPKSPTALIHQICQLPLSHLMGHPSLVRTPLSEPQRQRCPCFTTTTELGGGGGVTKERRWGLMGGGQGGKTHVLCLKYLLSEKKFTGPLHLDPTHVSFWVAAILIHPWSLALSRIDSRWKKKAYLRGTPIPLCLYSFNNCLTLLCLSSPNKSLSFLAYPPPITAWPLSACPPQQHSLYTVPGALPLTCKV